MPKLIEIVVTIVLLTGAGGPALAQDAGPPKPAPQQPAAEEPVSDQGDEEEFDATESGDYDDEDGFRPSQDVSSDQSLKYPIDI